MSDDDNLPGWRVIKQIDGKTRLHYFRDGVSLCQKIVARVGSPVEFDRSKDWCYDCYKFSPDLIEEMDRLDKEFPEYPEQ